MALVPMQYENPDTGWENRGQITTSSGTGNCYLYLNKKIGLAILEFASGANSSDGTFTLPSDIKPSATIHAALRGTEGYISVTIQQRQGIIANNRQYAVGSLAFPYYYES